MSETKLTIKQRKWLDVYVETGNACEAARQAGYEGNDVTLKHIGYENVTKLNLPISDLMDRMGLTDAALMQKLQTLLSAKQSKIATDKGKITDVQEFEDNGTQLKALELSMRLKNKLSARVEVVNAGETSLDTLRDTLNNGNTEQP